MTEEARVYVELIDWLIGCQKKIMKTDPILANKYTEGIIFGLQLARDTILHGK
mgnify:CR=1 FL=1